MAIYQDTGQIPPSADVVIVGTGFAATFFLSRILLTARPDLKIAVLERGKFYTHQDFIEKNDSAELAATNYYRAAEGDNKEWNFRIAVGGSSNCWTGNTPRMLPADFELKSRFGHGRDWPFTYDDLEPYYAEAEALMQIAGAPFPAAPMSRPYPLPPHHPSLPDALLARAWPGLHGPMPTARASRPTEKRPQCCTNGVCAVCPVQAKFTIINEMLDPFDDPRVTCIADCEARALVIEGGEARGVQWRGGNGREGEIRADQIVLAANAIANPALLKRSGDPLPFTGRRLHETVGLELRVLLDGVDGFQGSTIVSGLGLQLWDDPERRKTMAGALLEMVNIAPMRFEPGKWRQMQQVRLVFEDLPDDDSQVTLEEGDDRPVTRFAGIAPYTQRAMDRAEDDLARIFASLPVEGIEFLDQTGTESHIQGTTVMGNDPKTSVVDQDGLHHHWRNVRLLGSSVFPTGSPANPTLTLAAHALRAADRMDGA